MCWHQRPLRAKVSNSATSSVLSLVATAVGEWLWVCRVFLAQTEVLSFFKVLDMKQWSGLNFQASLLVDSPFGCPLRQFNGATSLPSCLSSHFPTACLSFNFFLPPHNPSKLNRCSGEIQGSKNAKLRLSCRTLPSSKLPVQSNFCPPYHKPRAFCPNLSHSIHHLVACSYDNEGLSREVSLSDNFLKQR